jgi:hypothetical protein
MKKCRFSILTILFLLVCQIVVAQIKTEKYAVAGVCGMCKSKIESAAKKGGASYALWNEETKELTVKYNSGVSHAAKIQKEVAGVGYDTRSYKATAAAYNKLHECCKYERTSAAANACCTNEACTKNACFKESKCTPDAVCCKDGDCSKNDCCTK